MISVVSKMQLNLYSITHLNNKFIVDKQTDIVKVNHPVERSSIFKLNYDPAKEFILNVKQYADKLAYRNQK